jgi:transposase
VVTEPIRMCELLVGLPDVNVLAVADPSPTTALRVEVEARVETPVTCDACGAVANIKDRPPVVLVDLPAFGRPTRLVWRKRRWQCPDPRCVTASWTELEPRIAAPRMSMTSRAGRWSTL